MFTGRFRTKTLTYPHTGKSRGVKSSDHGGQAIIPPRSIQAANFHVTREDHIEHL